MRSRSLRTTLALALAGALALGGPAAAVHEDHGDRLVSANPADMTPHVMNGAVKAVTQVGNKVIAAGKFSTVSPAGTYGDASDDVTRHGIFAFDATTGAIDPSFDPDLGDEANSLDTDGTHVYVSGRFASVGGDTSIKRVVKLTAGGDVVPGFQAVPNSWVNEVVVRGGRVYVGGRFTAVAHGPTTTPRDALAALDPRTGAVLPGVAVPFRGYYDPGTERKGGRTEILRFDVTADGSRLAAVGNFARVGARRRSAVAVLDTGRTPARVAGWSTDRFERSRNASCSRNFDTIARDVDFSPDGSYFAVSTTGAFGGGSATGTLCDTISRWQTAGAGKNPRWVDYTGGDTTYGVAVTGSAVYVGGHMRWLNNPYQGNEAGPGAVPRSGIAALDPRNGLPLSWNPGRTGGVGAQALFATDQGLWVGSDTTWIGHEQHGRVAFLPLAGGTTVPTSRGATLPNAMLVAVPRRSGGILQRRPVGASGAPAGRRSLADASMDWSQVRGGFLLGDTVYYGWADGSLHRRRLSSPDGATGELPLVDLYADPETGNAVPFPIRRVSGMFFDPGTHRLYYTVRGNRGLFYRYFTPESAVVGAQTFRAGTNGVSFAGARGLTLASGWIYYGTRGGKALRRVRFTGGRVRGGSAVASRDGGWSARAILTPTG